MQCARLAQEQESPGSRGWLEREIDLVSGQIRDAVAGDSVYPFSLDVFDAQIEWLRRFARERPVLVEATMGGR